MKKLLLLLFLIPNLVIPLNLNAEARGLPATDCGYFIKKDRLNNEEITSVNRLSILAYMSALEFLTQYNKIKDISNDSLYYAVLQECKNKPLKNVGDAMLHVYFNELKSK
ncbi:MAG: hypothetical protein HOB48_04530 [Flavobacteriaceae bacterium]|nr:hypothetical protein [Flavobacteriaceae bacterium]